MSRSDSIEEGGNIVDPDGPSEPGKAGKPGKSGKPNQPAGSWSPSPRVEYSLIGLLAIFVFAASWLGFSQVAEPLIPNVDLWFDADTRRAYLTMTVLDAKRSSVHPIFPSLARVLMQPFERLLSGPLPAVHALTATLAAFWWLLHVAVLRRVGCGLAAALVFSCLAVSSAASVFFHTVPETYALGSIGILLALWASAGTTSAWEIVALNVLTLGTTVTNWMAGLLASVASRGLKRGALLALLGLAVVFAVWLLQSTLFTRNAAFWNVQAELPWLLRPEAGGIVSRLRGFFFHSMLMPDFIIVPKTYWTALDLWSGPQQLLFLTQSAAAGSGSRAGPLGLLLWAGLLVTGGIALFRGDAPVRFRAVLGLTLLGQLGLHLLYGIETFLYSLHYLPLLTLLAALASRGTSRAAMGSTIAAAFLVPLVLGNNLRQFEIAAVALQTGSSNLSKWQMTNRVDGTPQRLLVSLTFDGREPARAGWPTSLQGPRDERCLVRDLPSGGRSSTAASAVGAAMSRSR